MEKRVENLKNTLEEMYDARLGECNYDVLDGKLLVYKSMLGLTGLNRNKTYEELEGVLQEQLTSMEDLCNKHRKLGFDTEDTLNQEKGIEGARVLLHLIGKDKL